MTFIDTGFVPCRGQRRFYWIAKAMIIPHRVKVYTEFNLATRLKMVKVMELNVCEF